MDNMEYLNQISASNRPAKSNIGGGLLPFSISPKILIGIGIAIGLIFLIMIFGSIFGGDSNSELTLVQKLDLRSENLSRTIEEYNRNLKSSELRSMSSSLRAVLNEASASTATILEEDFGAKSDKKIEEEETTYIEEVNTTLENAKLNGLLDREFVREMTYQIGLLLSMESDILTKTKKDNLKEFIDSSYTNLDNLHTEFSEYSNGTT